MRKSVKTEYLGLKYKWAQVLKVAVSISSIFVFSFSLTPPRLLLTEFEILPPRLRSREVMMIMITKNTMKTFTFQLKNMRNQEKTFFDLNFRVI